MLDWARLLIPALRRLARVANALVPDRRSPAHLAHSRPREECPLPIEGAPYYLAGITIGSPVSDFGSHAGVKAAVEPFGVATGRDLLEVAHYAGFQASSQRIDRSRVVLEGLPLGRTELEFRPWGWIERLEGPGARVEARVATLVEDAFLLFARVRNVGATALRFVPRLEILRERDPVHEAMQPFQLSRAGRTTTARLGGGRALVRFFRRTFPGALDFDSLRFDRAIAAVGGPLRRAPRPAPDVLVALAALPRAVAPGGAADIAFLVGCGEDPAEARRALARGEERLAAAGGSPERALDEIDADWQTFLAALPLPEDASADLRRVVDLAATGLRMSVYGPRAAIRGRIAAAAKVHFNTFFAWDTPICALGMKEYDPPLAKEVLASHLALMRPDGLVCNAVGARGEPVNAAVSRTSQPPVWFVAVEEVFRKDGARDTAWLASLYPRLERNLAWWDARRRDAETGLYCYAWAMESGWDDTPRIPNPRIEPLRALGLDLGNVSGLTPIERLASVDLNAWMFLAFEAMERLARRLGRGHDAARHAARARDLAARVERHFWDDEVGAYFDRDLARDRPIRVLTPAVIWPLFAGIVRDRARARRVVEEHLLDPKKLFPDPDDPAAPGFPVPSVALNDPAYDRATDGYYWRGQIWLVPCYAALTAPFRYGYEKEAAALRARVLRLLARASEGGLFETYDPRTGEIGFGSGALTGPGEPACFQIGLTTAVALEIALARHERRRYVSPGDRGFEGAVEEARGLESGEVIYRVIEPEDEAPHARVRIAGDGSIEVLLDDPRRTFGRAEARIEVRGERRTVRLGEPVRFGLATAAS
jgi:hypothetical protein